MIFVAVIIQVIIMYKLPMFITRKDVEFAITVTTAVRNPAYDNCSPNKRPRPSKWCDRSRQHKWTPIHTDSSYRLHRPLMPTWWDAPSHTQFVEALMRVRQSFGNSFSCSSKTRLATGCFLEDDDDDTDLDAWSTWSASPWLRRNMRPDGMDLNVVWNNLLSLAWSCLSSFPFPSSSSSSWFRSLRIDLLLPRRFDVAAAVSVFLRVWLFSLLVTTSSVLLLEDANLSPRRRLRTVTPIGRGIASSSSNEDDEDDWCMMMLILCTVWPRWYGFFPVFVPPLRLLLHRRWICISKMGHLTIGTGTFLSYLYASKTYDTSRHILPVETYHNRLRFHLSDSVKILDIITKTTTTTKDADQHHREIDFHYCFTMSVGPYIMANIKCSRHHCSTRCIILLFTRFCQRYLSNVAISWLSCNGQYCWWHDRETARMCLVARPFHGSSISNDWMDDSTTNTIVCRHGSTSKRYCHEWRLL